MLNKTKEILEESISEVNDMITHGSRIENRDDFELLGSNHIDSLTFINFISTIETVIEAKLGVTITLVDDDVLMSSDAPFRTIGSLKKYIEKAIL